MNKKGNSRLNMVRERSNSFPSRNKGTGWVTEFFLGITRSLLSTFGAGATKGSIEIKGLTYFIDVPPQYMNMEDGPCFLDFYCTLGDKISYNMDKINKQFTA